MPKTWVDFKAVKEAVSMEMVLEHYSIQLRRVNKTQLRGKCPLPTHSSEKGESFNVNVLKNAWNCKSQSCAAARGRSGGNQLDFVSVIENCSVRDAALKLQEWFNIPSEERSEQAPTKKSAELVAGKESPRERAKPPPSDNQESDESAKNEPLKFTLKGIDPRHAYLTHRGIRPETAEYFGVGFFSGKGSMSGRVVIPIHNERGELVAYAGRAVDDEEPKYKLPAGFQKSVELYNLNRALKAGEGRGVIVVEGFFDVMKVHQAGYSLVIGLMGSTLSVHQRALLVAHFDRVVLMLDGDEAGQEAAGVIAGQLIRDLFVQVVTLQASQQPDRLSSEEIRHVLSFLRN